MQHCPGPERALIYRLAVLTGLRANEIRTLRKNSFELDGSPPTVTVEAAFSKHRRQDIQPLHSELVARLHERLATKADDELAFHMPKRPIEAIRIDLRNAGVQYKTKQGFADFHALRHTFITRLMKAGVNAKTAQTLARHRDASLTLNVYSHMELIDQVAALKVLSRLEGEATMQKQRAVVTGTRTGNEERVNKCTKNQLHNSCSPAALSGISWHSTAQKAEEERSSNTGGMSTLDKVWHAEARKGREGKKVGGAGIEPARPLGQRILSPLCLPFHHPPGSHPL